MNLLAWIVKLNGCTVSKEDAHEDRASGENGRLQGDPCHSRGDVFALHQSTDIGGIARSMIQ